MSQEEAARKKTYYSFDSIDFGIKKAKEMSEIKKLKFKESVDIAINLGTDPKQTNQSVRGSIVLPRGSGKTTKVIVLTENEEQQKLALEAGAMMSGADNLISKIESGFLDFDFCIATHDVMQKISRLAKKLGSRGLMPSTKNGTITDNVVKSVSEFLGGKINFKSDKSGTVHCLIGKVDFDEKHLVENALAVIKAIKDLRPETLKGRLINSVYLSTTMGPSIKISAEFL